MKKCSVLLLLTLCNVGALSQSNLETDKVAVNVADEPALMPEHVSAKTVEEDSPEIAEMKEDEMEEVVVSKDNLIQILRAIALAFTHKADPTYQHIIEAGGKQLMKLVEKKIGDDKHMKGLLKIIKKYVHDFKLEGMTTEEEKVLSELAQNYLAKHKFKVLFPESLLLHQPEMEQFVAKKRELGELEGRQLDFDLAPYISRLQDFGTNIRARIQSMPIFSNFNFDRIGSTLGTAFDSYMPALRNTAGGLDLGVSMGSLTALAAAGALISAPFFLRSFSANAREDNEETFFGNRRVGNFAPAPQQFIDSTDKESFGHIKRPEWMQQLQNHEAKPYNPKINPHYSEPTFSLNPHPPVNDPNAIQDDEAYNKYLTDYNNWLQQYHNALNSQETQEDKEYQSYYKKYREWYSQYYNEEFGEDLPEHQQAAPNAYEENNNIANMGPPPSPAQNFENDQNAAHSSNDEATMIYQGTSKNPEPNYQEQENSSFQVIHVDESNQWQANQYQPELYNIQAPQVPKNIERNDQFTPEVQTPQIPQERPLIGRPNLQLPQSNPLIRRPNPQLTQANPLIRRPNPQLPQASPLIGRPNPQLVRVNQNVNYHHYVSPRPVYVKPEQVGPVTEIGFRPLGSEDKTGYIVNNRQNTFYRPAEVTPQPENNQNEHNFDGFSSVKSISIFNPSVYETQQAQSSAPTPIPNHIKLVQEKRKSNRPLRVDRNKLSLPRPTPKPVVSSVTSGIFKTLATTTEEAATTPVNHYPGKGSVRVVTSTSVVTSPTVVKTFKAKVKELKETKDAKKRKITLTELLKNHKKKDYAKDYAKPATAAVPSVYRTSTSTTAAAPRQPDIIEERIDTNRIDIDDQIELPKVASRPAAPDDGLPVYTLDPFYGPRLSRTDAIFHQLSLTKEGCREQVVCNMYKNPNAYTPLSDFLSRQLTVTYEQLKRPTVKDDRILRFFKYLQAARAGQDGFDCLKRYPNCDTDTTRLSYKPIVNAYKKVSVLMNASGSS